MSNQPKESASPEPPAATHEPAGPEVDAEPTQAPQEIGGPRGLEPTRYGDWERKGRCIDF